MRRKFSNDSLNILDLSKVGKDRMIVLNHGRSLPFLHRYYLLLKLHYLLFFAAIYPISSIRALTNLEISYINLVISFVIFLTNPFFGLIADRSGRFRLIFNIILIFYGILFVFPSMKTLNISMLKFLKLIR